jgi:ribosomal protein S18 acetylase RimI-like enzyme
VSNPSITTKPLAGSIQIRLAQLPDARAIATIHVDGWRVAYRGIMPDALLDNLDPDEVTLRWIERIQSEASRIYVASARGKVVGWAAFRLLRDNVPLRGELMGLYLAPDHWRKGYGTLLYRTGEEDYRDSGASEISLWVLAKNYGARLFYRKHGYRWSGILRMPEYGNRPCMTLQYRKSLKG